MTATDPAPDTVDGDRLDRALSIVERALTKSGWTVVELTRERDDLAAQVATLTAERDAAVASLLELQPLAPIARLTAELAERTRERDAARTLNRLSGETVAGLERENARMRDVIEAAIALDAVEATRTDASDNCSVWLTAHADAVGAVLAAVERYQHPAVTVSPDATDPDCGCPTGAGHTCGHLDDDRCTCAWNNGYLREPPRIGHRPGCPAGTPQQPETVVQPNTGAQGPDAVQDRTEALEAAYLAAARAYCLDQFSYDAAYQPGGREQHIDNDTSSTVDETWLKAVVDAAAPLIQREALLRAAVLLKTAAIDAGSYSAQRYLEHLAENGWPE